MTFAGAASYLSTLIYEGFLVSQSKEGKKAKNFSESHKTSHCELAIF